jgi:tetratricopeptide (TPR) repeat protein
LIAEEVWMLVSAHEEALRDGLWDRSALQCEALLTKGSADPGIGESLGNYRLAELIGTGGMGRVYRAVRADQEYEQHVAIKRIRPGLDVDQIISRFRSERQILATLEHPNIARLLDGGTDRNGLPYLVMEYVEGTQPLEYCDSHGFTIARRLALFRDICAAVQYAHQHMVVHRDLKPANILITARGIPKLLDFGIAKVLAPDPVSLGAQTETALHMMTARYCSPEQVRGEPITTASDVYSLGVILYELLTGHSPYTNPTRPVHELMRAVCEENPVRRNLPGELDTIVFKALKKDVGERYASADRFSEDIQRFLEKRPIQARADSWWYVTRKFVVRHRLASLSGAVVLCAFAISFAMVSQARGRAERRFNQVRELAHAVIFDYHDAIEPLPGSTPVIERLMVDGLRYLDSLSNEADSKDLRRETVDAYVRISEVQGDSYHGNLGNAKGALQSAGKAVAAAQRMLLSDRSPEAMKSAAAAYAVQGTLLYTAGDLRSAERLLRQATDLGEATVRERPDIVDNSSALANNLRVLGDLYGGNGMQNLGDTTKAVQYYRRAADITWQLAARFPGDLSAQKGRYQALLSLAETEKALGRMDDSAADLHKVVELIGNVLKEHPNDAPAQVEFANASVQLGQLLLDARKAPEAVPYIALSAETLERLSAADPKNNLYRRNLSLVETQYAAALRGSGDFAGALVYNRKALERVEALSARTPGSLEYRTDIGVDHRKLADTLLASGNLRAAFEESEEGARLLCSMAGDSADAYLKASCGRALVVSGLAQSELGRGDSAVTTLRRAVAMASDVSRADPQNAIFRSDLARSKTACATGLQRDRRTEEAKQEYARALVDWSVLRKSKAITSEDSHRAEETEAALAALSAK